jgi:hypothetical protein
VSAQAAIKQAVYDLLRADAGVASVLAEDPDAGSPSRPAVFDHVPQRSKPETASFFPYVVIGEVVIGEFDTDDIDGQETVLTLHVWDRYRGRKRVLQALDAIYDALHNADFSISGQHLVYCYFDFAEVLEEDGPTSQHAVTRFRIVTQES